jgi:hypothetical protein
VEIAPTVIVSNSDESQINDDSSGNTNETDEHSTDTGSNENSAGDSEPPTSELSSYSEGGAATDDTSPIVAVAEIEASRDIALAEIGASVERERIEVEAEQIKENEELVECQRQIAELREQVENLTNLLTPPPALEEMGMDELQIAPEMNLTEPSTVAPTPETQTELSDESVDENPVVEETVTVVERRFRAI